KYLVEHDWLDKVGERQGNGKFKVPIFKTKQGTVPETFVDGRSRNRIRNVQRRQGMKVSVTARDETFIPEVEPVKVNTYEVECEPSLFSLFGSDGAFGTSSSVRDTHKESQTAETIHPANKSMNEGTLEPTEPETTSQSMPRSQAGVPRQV